MSGLGDEAELRRLRQEWLDAERSRREDAPAQGATAVVGVIVPFETATTQWVTVQGAPTGGGFTLSGLKADNVTRFDAAIPFDASAAAVRSALNAAYGSAVFTAATGGPLPASKVILTDGPKLVAREWAFEGGGAPTARTIQVSRAAGAGGVGARYRIQVQAVLGTEEAGPADIAPTGGYIYAAYVGRYAPPMGAQVLAIRIGTTYVFPYY